MRPRFVAVLAAASMAVPPVGAVAQVPEPPAAHTIRWYEATAAVAGVAVLMLLDEPVQRYAQAHRSQTGDDLAAVFRRVGQPEVFGTVSVGLLAVGLLDDRPTVTRAGGRLVASLALAGAWTITLKTILGRSRPSAGAGAFQFAPFSENQALPSGHTAVAFALATDLADELDNGWARVGLYTLASGTALSRINDDRHWLSDVALGALVGITSAKLVRGRWRAFSISPPRFLLEPEERARIGWRLAF